MPSDRELDRELERELREIGDRIEYPPTPDLARAVRQRLDEEGTSTPSAQPSPRPQHDLPALRWVVAAALVLIFAIPVFSGLRAGLDGSFGGAGGAASSGSSAGGAAQSGGAASESGQEADEQASEGRRAADGGGGSGNEVAENDEVGEAAGESQSGATACAAPLPDLYVEPAKAAPGEEILVRGRLFKDRTNGGCDDTGSGDTGPAPDAPLPEPLRNIRVVLRQDGREWELASVDADRVFAFDVRVRVPVGANPGRAVLNADPGSATERFVVLER